MILFVIPQEVERDEDEDSDVSSDDDMPELEGGVCGSKLFEQSFSGALFARVD
jgi:hypothetical protein